MLHSTTSTLDGKTIETYHGLVTGEVILGTNVFRDVFASFRDFFGGRARGYEKALADGRDEAIAEMNERAAELGANAIVGIDVDYESMGGSMLIVCVSGTAVTIK